MAEQGHPTSERSKCGKILRYALSDTVDAGQIAANDTAEVELLKVVRPEKVSLDVAQATALVPAAAYRIGPMIDVALDTGVCPGELYALHWDDFDPVTGTLFVRRSLEELKGQLRLKETKNEWSRRRIRLAARTAAALAAFRERMRREGRDVDAGLVFCDTEGGFLRQSKVNRRLLRPALKAAGLPAIRPYDLRHTCATLLLSRDVNVRVVSERLGHEDVQTTLRHYAHALPSMQQRVADVIDALFGGPEGDSPIDVPLG